MKYFPPYELVMRLTSYRSIEYNVRGYRHLPFGTSKAASADVPVTREVPISDRETSSI